MVWIFAHRFHAEFSVARLLAPFLLAAPTYDVQLLLATQVADEHRHLQAVLRIYDEVFGVRGGIDAVREVADRNMDLVAEALYERLEHHVGQALGDLGRGRVPGSGRRLPPAGRGRDRAHGAEPRRDPVRAALVPRPRRGSAPRRARRGAAHRDRRLLRPPAHGSGTRAHERGHHRADRGAARAVGGVARPGRRRARRPRALGLRDRARSTSTARRCDSCSSGSHRSATTQASRTERSPARARLHPHGLLLPAARGHHRACPRAGGEPRRARPRGHDRDRATAPRSARCRSRTIACIASDDVELVHMGAGAAALRQRLADAAHRPPARHATAPPLLRRAAVRRRAHPRARTTRASSCSPRSCCPQARSASAPITPSSPPGACATSCMLPRAPRSAGCTATSSSRTSASSRSTTTSPSSPGASSRTASTRITSRPAPSRSPRCARAATRSSSSSAASIRATASGSCSRRSTSSGARATATRACASWATGLCGATTRAGSRPRSREAVHWAGRIDWNRPRYYASADVFCTPCQRASFGMVLLEAMSCGRPVVGSLISGFERLLTSGREGLLVAPQDDPARVRRRARAPARLAGRAGAHGSRGTRHRHHALRLEQRRRRARGRTTWSCAASCPSSRPPARPRRRGRRGSCTPSDRMSGVARLVSTWLPPLVWMAVIFAFSSQHGGGHLPEAEVAAAQARARDRVLRADAPAAARAAPLGRRRRRARRDRARRSPTRSATSGTSRSCPAARRRRGTSRSTASASRSRRSPPPAPGCASAPHEPARSSSPSARSPPAATRSGRRRSSTSRAASPPSASSTSPPCPAREDAVAALEAWAGEDVSSWRLELGRFYDDHARVHLRRDPGTAALLASLRADGVRLAVYGQGPRETSAVTLAFLGLDRRLDAVVLEPAGDGYAACLEALGVSEARHVSDARGARRALASVGRAAARPRARSARSRAPGRRAARSSRARRCRTRRRAARRSGARPRAAGSRRRWRCATSSPSCTSTTSRPSRRSSSSGTSSWSGSSCSIRRMIDVVAQTDGAIPSRSKRSWLRGSLTRAITRSTP